MPEHPMTDDELDARLRRAGVAWRAAEDDPVAAPPARRTTRRSHRVLAVAAAVLAAAAVVAGGVVLRGRTDRSPDDTAGAALVGTVWQLIGYGSRSDPHSSATFYLGGDGTFVADDPCEVISGQASVAGDRLDFTRRVIRYRSCTDSVGETVFTPGLHLLSGSTPYAQHGDDLTIGTGPRAYHLTAAPGSPRPVLDVPTLVGATWQLVSGRSPSGTVGGGGLRLRIGDSGSVTVTPKGCVVMAGPARVSGSTVDFDARGSGACPAGSPGALVRDVLAGRTSAIVRAGTLTIGKPGTGILTYRWIPSDTSVTAVSALRDVAWSSTQVAGSAVESGSLRVGSDGSVTGSDGCQALHAHAAVRPGTLTITGVPRSVPRSCPDRSVARTTDSLLAGPVLWAVRDGRLVINGSGAQAFGLVYTVEPQDRLVGTSWRLVRYRTDGKAVAVHGRHVLSFTRRSIAFDDGMNANVGPVRIDRTTFHVGELAATAVGCAGSCLLPATVDAVLEHSPSYTLRGERLTITRRGEQLLYRRADAPATGTASAGPTAH